MKPSLEVRPEVLVLPPGTPWTKKRKAEIVSYTERLEAYAVGLEHQVRLFLFQRDTDIDPQGPPHEVPCPLCLAFAGEPCRTHPRPRRGRDLPGDWPFDSKMVAPHEERQEHWKEHPEYRVKFFKEKLW
jgi:hypothetical protein